MAELKWYGDKANKAAREAAMKALHLGAEAILTEAVKETPLDTGALERSAAVTDTEDAVYVSFNTPYARVQHEDMTLVHPRRGKAKYLEDPFKRNEEKVIRLVQARVKQALAGK